MLKEYPLSRVFTLIEPGPALLVATAEGRKKNIMTITWSMAMSFAPTFGIVTGPWNHSFDVLMKTRECVVAVPGVDLIDKVIGIGTCSGTDTDKFKKFSLTAKKAQSVRAPLIAECLFNLECQVSDCVDDHGIIVLECVRAWENTDRAERRTFHAVGDGTFVADGEKFDRRREMASKLPALSDTPSATPERVAATR